MPTLWDFYKMSLQEKKKWETLHSSLIRSGDVTYDQCRAYSCKNITDGLTRVVVKKGEILEIPQGVPFHFIGRVDTSKGNNNPKQYYQAFLNREFISYTTICNQNVSHYKGNIFFIYNISPEDIVHIFPMDSDTKKEATSEEDLTILPSLWITLPELEALSNKLEVYNQITVRTKRDGQIIKPVAIAAFEQTNEVVQKIADLFEIGIILLHPNTNAINYSRDLLHDWFKLKSISKIMEEDYGFSVESMYYYD